LKGAVFRQEAPAGTIPSPTVFHTYFPALAKPGLYHPAPALKEIDIPPVLR